MTTYINNPYANTIDCELQNNKINIDEKHVQNINKIIDKFLLIHKNNHIADVVEHDKLNTLQSLYEMWNNYINENIYNYTLVFIIKTIYVSYYADPTANDIDVVYDEFMYHCDNFVNVIFDNMVLSKIDPTREFYNIMLFWYNYGYFKIHDDYIDCVNTYFYDIYTTVTNCDTRTYVE